MTTLPDARGAARALKAAIAAGAVDVTPVYGVAPGGPRIGCPIHRGDGLHFEVYPDGGWRCHSRCHAGGDVFSFVAARELAVVPGTPLRGEMFERAVARALDLLHVGSNELGVALDGPTPPAVSKGKAKAYPPPAEVSRLLAHAHDLAPTDAPFVLGGRPRPGVGTFAAAAGAHLCYALGADLRDARPKWAKTWAPGLLFATYDERGTLASVHHRPDDTTKGKGRNPRGFNPAAWLMTDSMRALLRGESKDDKLRARVLGYDTVLESAHSHGVVLVEGTPGWCAWARWHLGPVLGLPGQGPTVGLLRRIPRHVPVLLDLDPDAAGLEYLRAALRGLVQHEDVRVSPRTRWLLDRAERAAKHPELFEAELAGARAKDPRMLDPDELAAAPTTTLEDFVPLPADERVTILGEGASYGTEWAQHLRIDKEGRLLASEGNLMLALRHDERWLGVLGYDKRTDQSVWMRKPPVPDMDSGSYPRALRDEDISFVAAWYENEIAVAFPNAAVHRAIDATAALNPFDRVEEYLLRVGRAWDKKPRLDEWLVRYVGAEDTPLTRAVGAKWMISAVARALRPGCKADYLLVFEGKQGTRKSSTFAALCPDPAFFTDAVPDLRFDKSAAEIVTCGAWIIELAELDSVARADASAVKAFITRTSERFRGAYKHYVREHPRRVVFCASTNEGNYLRDQTGNRRFWPVQVGEIQLEEITAHRDQLWGEAVSRFQSGELWYLDRPELEQEAEAQQDARREQDPWELPIVAYLESWREFVEGRGREPGCVRIVDLPMRCLEKLDVSVKASTARDTRRVNAILRAVGWDRVQRRDAGKRAWAWEPTEGWMGPRPSLPPGPDGGVTGSGGPSPGVEGASPGVGDTPGDGSSARNDSGLGARHQRHQDLSRAHTREDDKKTKFDPGQDTYRETSPLLVTPPKSPAVWGVGDPTPGDGPGLALDFEDDFDARIPADGDRF